MRITTRLRIMSGVMTTALIVLAPVLLVLLAEFKAAKNDYVLAGAIEANFFERTAFRDQYFLYREDRARAQWDRLNEAADRLLREAKAQFHNKDDLLILERLRRNIESNAAIFQRIADNTSALKMTTANHRIYEELDKRLYSQMLVRSATVRDLVAALQDANAQRIEQTYRYLTVVMALFAATLVSASILAAMHLARLIRKRLAPLHEGAKIVAGGNLNHRIQSDGADEFAELARSINSMTDKLAAEISAHSRLENAVRESEATLQAILSAAEVAISWANEDGVIEYVNPKFISLFGYTLDDIPTLEQWYLHAYPDPAYRAKAVGEWATKIARSLPEKTAIEPIELNITCKDGSVRYVLLMASWAGTRLLANFSDITERKQAEEVVRHMAHHDALTGLPNRIMLSDRLEQSFVMSKRNKTHLAIMLLDLDKFKPINDTHGHAVGDLMLQEAAKRMQHCVRESDTVSRLGGDEFVVLLPVIETTHDAMSVAEKIQHALNRPFELAGHTLAISASIGVSIYPDHGNDETVLIKCADIAMYQAKKSGRNTVMLYQPGMQSENEMPALKQTRPAA